MAKGKVLKTIIDISGEISPTLGKSLGSVVDKLEGVNLKAVAVAASIAAIGGAAIVGVGKATAYLKDLGTEYDKASNQMAASTGLVGDELANMEQQMKDVYGNNFGEDMQDVSESMSEVYRQTKLTGDALQNTTEGAFALRDTFGYDIPETARAAKAMMENFGISGEKAMNLIAAGAQNGLDFSGEMIDSINEYSVQFAKLGFDADDMFKIFEKGAESGAWNLDKVGDAIKEFSIRSIDGSKTTKTAFKDLNMDADSMMSTFAKGGEGAEKAFQQVIKKLMEVDNEVKRDEIGVALFGTQWEDLGVDAVAAMADVKDSAYGTGKELENINNVKYNDLDSAIQGIKRTFEVSMLPAAEKVTEALIDIAPKVEEMVAKAGPYLADLAEKIGPAIEKAIELGEKGFEFVSQKAQEVAPIVQDFVDNGIVYFKENAEWLIPVISGLTGALGAYKLMVMLTTVWEKLMNLEFVKQIKTMGLVKGVTAGLSKAFGALNWKFILIAAVIGAVVAAGVWLYRNWDTVKAKAAELAAWLGEKWTQIKSKTAEIWGNMVSAMSQWWSNIKSTVSNAVGNAVSTVVNKWNEVKARTVEIWGNIVSALQNKWNEIKNKVSEFVSNVKKKFEDGWSKLTSILTAPFDTVMGVIDSVKTKVGGLIDKIGEAITGAGSISVPGKAKGGFTNGLTFAGEDPSYPVEAVISFNPAYRDQNLAYWAQAGRMLGADISDYTLGGSSGGDYYDLGGVVFAPNITITGNADKQTIMDAIEDEYPDFLDMLEELIERRRKPAYA